MPDKVFQKEVTDTQAKKPDGPRGTVKIVMRKIKVSTLSLLVVCASVYDTKPVHLMSTAHHVVTLDTKMRKVWNHTLGMQWECTACANVGAVRFCIYLDENSPRGSN